MSRGLTSKSNGLKPERFKVIEIGFMIDAEDAQADLEIQTLPRHARRALMYWQSERKATTDDLLSYQDSIAEEDSLVPLEVLDPEEES